MDHIGKTMERTTCNGRKKWKHRYLKYFLMKNIMNSNEEFILCNVEINPTSVSFLFTFKHRFYPNTGLSSYGSALSFIAQMT